MSSVQRAQERLFEAGEVDDDGNGRRSDVLGFVVRRSQATSARAPRSSGGAESGEPATMQGAPPRAEGLRRAR